MSEIKKTRDENFDDIVFAHRNKEYGAYELRKKYRKSVIKSLSFAFILLLFTTITPLIMAFNNKDGNNIVNETYTAELMDLENPNDVPPPPPPPPPPPVLDVEQIKYTAPKVVENAKEDTIEMQTNDNLLANNTITDLPDDPLIEKKNIIIDDDKPVEFYGIEEKPEFPGGERAMLEWVMKNTKYPEISREMGVTGKVCVNFIINKDGKVTKVELLNSIDEYLDKEALRVISSMPDWKPGKNNGKNVNVSFRLPIKFTLGN